MSAKSHCSIFHLRDCKQLSSHSFSLRGSSTVCRLLGLGFLCLTPVAGTRQQRLEVLKLVCWDRKAFKCSEYFEVREEFVLDVTPEMTLPGAGGGYLSEQGESQCKVPLMVMCGSKRPSLSLCCATAATCWAGGPSTWGGFGLEHLSTTTFDQTNPPILEQSLWGFPKGENRYFHGKGLMPTSASAQWGRVFSKGGVTEWILVPVATDGTCILCRISHEDKYVMGTEEQRSCFISAFSLAVLGAQNRCEMNEMCLLGKESRQRHHLGFRTRSEV